MDGRRRFFSWVRTLHLYISMLGAVLFLFFAATGFILNHEEWLGLDAGKTRVTEGALPRELLAGPDRRAIEEKLRQGFGARGIVSSFEVQEDVVLVAFKSPGRRMDATIDRADGKLQLVEETRGVLGRLGDLHRGEDCGGAWKRLIDGMALLLAASGLTGLLLWLSLPSWRVAGLAMLAVGAAAAGVLYVLFVP